MPNTLYTPEQVAQVAVKIAQQSGFLSAMISRNMENDLLGGGGRGRTVNLKVPGTLIARSRDIDETTAAIVLDNVTESTVPVTLGEHLYSAVSLSEGDMSLDLANFSTQILAPQVEAVVERIEHNVATALRAVPESTDFAYSAANPLATFTALRKHLVDLGVPTAGLNVVVGTQIYADLLEAKAITDASESGSTEALREGGVGRLRGFTIVESARLDEDEIVAFHRDAFALAVRAPMIPEGASFGAVQSANGFQLRYLRDYDAMHTVDRSIVSTFAGVAGLPLYRAVRNYDTNAATLETIPNGGAVRILASTVPAP